MLGRRCCSAWMLLVLTGCVPHTDPPTTATDPAPPVSTDAPLPPDPPQAPAAAAHAVLDQGGAAPAAAPPAEPTPSAPSAEPPSDPAGGTLPETPAPPADGNVRVEAKAGVGSQGQSLKNDTGVLVEAAKAYFNVRQRAVFEIEIPKNMQLFEATEGRKPNSHEEFMQKIITANGVKLPNLPANHRYVYDPQQGELMVEKPAR